ncbi:hypothetical protein JCM33374_g4273 [Metschnikowia sp. JCM 33374]|nr:hypothetical protein JCM33374_g4273 [Metschnikowia sp. JCM 33374]
MNINPESAKEIPCKNVLIYGYCKFENKGCVFSHPTPENAENAESPNSANNIGTPTSKQINMAGNTSNSTTKSESFLASGMGAASSPTPTGKIPGSASTDSKRKFNMNTPSFQPSVQSITNKFAALSPKIKEVPIFVPSGMDSSSTAPSGSISNPENNSAAHNSFAARKFNTSTPSFTPSSPFESAFSFPTSNSANSDGFNPHYGQLSSTTNNSPFPSSSQVSQSAVQPPKQQNPYLNTPTPAVTSSSVNAHSTADFMFHNSATSSYPLNHHLYAPAPPPRLVAPLKPHETNVNDMFIPNNLRETLTKKNEATLQTLPQSSLPEHVGVYHSLVPIGSSFEQISNVYQLPSCVYKVLSNYDGLPYALRQIDQGSKLRITNENPFVNVKKWKALKNPNVVRLNDAFTSVSRSTTGEPSLFLAYDYYPLANTLQEQHITRRLGGKLEPITEDILWSYLVQLTGALLSIHEAGLHAGSSLSLSKVLVTNKNRVRLGAVGVDDILEFESLELLRDQMDDEEILRKLQLGDITRLGKIITDLASTILPISLRGVPTASLMAHLQRSSITTISSSMTNALTALQEADGDFDLGEFYTTHLSRASLRLVNGLQDSTDYFEGQLLSEIENGRLFRLLAKINVVLDRPENDGDTSGSTYVIRSFRDYLFQTFDEYGKPAVDLSKILVNLNKLDVGVDEKLLLISREEDSCIIVSYKEIKDTLDQCFRTLIR